MRQLTACPLCEGAQPGRLVDLVRTEGNPYGLSTLKGHPAQYVICTACGFVFQNPTLDEDELARLYGGEYRTYDPPQDYLDGQQSIARALCDWVDEHIGDTVPYRRVLDIGCGAGCFLAEFKKRGWETVGVEASPRWVEWGRTNLGLDLRGGLFDEHMLEGEEFTLILFSHVVEHLPNPLPMLRAIARRLNKQGLLFLGAPNVLRPPTEDLSRNFMAGPHVCLYSPRTIRRLMAKAGFDVTYQDNWYPRGLRLLAKPTIQSASSEIPLTDDWKVVARLYAGLTGDSAHDVFAQNLAALVPRHYGVLERIAERPRGSTPKITKNNGTVVNLAISTPTGSLPLLADEAAVGGAVSQGETLTLPRQGLAVLAGLALGESAGRLLPELERQDARLFIHEEDLVVARMGLSVRDLTGLLRSPRVRLSVGPEIAIANSTKVWFREASQIVWLTDERLHPRIKQWRYDRTIRSLKHWCRQQAIMVEDRTVSGSWSLELARQAS